jgi:DNA polymerase-1
MLLVDAALEGRQAKMLLQVHDELVLEAPPEEATEIGTMLVAQMKKAAELAVPLEVDLGQGDTGAEAH